MTLLEWVRGTWPGEERVLGSEVQICHSDGSVSSLWRREAETQIPERLAKLQAIYSEVDGAALFSSAFKIAAIERPRRAGSVKLVPTLSEIAAAAAAEGCTTPANATIFMRQEGIGFYAVDSKSGRVTEFDMETGDVTPYSDVFTVFDEWLSAVRDAR